MSTEQSPSDVQTSTIVSRSPGLAYERMREVRSSHFTGSVVRRLLVQSSLLGILAAALALVLSVGPGTTVVSTPDLGVLGAGAGALVTMGATVHAAIGAYRLRNEPLTERKALRLLIVEDATSYLGIGSGGLLVAATAIIAGIAVSGWTVPIRVTTTVTAAAAAGATVAAVLTLVTAQYLRGRLPDDR